MSQNAATIIHRMKTHLRPQFVCSARFEQDLIHKIADRAVAMAESAGSRYDKLSVCMDPAAP